MKVFVVMWTDTESDPEALVGVYERRADAEAYIAGICRDEYNGYRAGAEHAMREAEMWRRGGAAVINAPSRVMPFEEYAARWDNHGPLVIAEVEWHA